MNPWDDLPNGKRIDEVLEFVREGNGVVHIASRYEAWDMEKILAWADARDAVFNAVRDSLEDIAGGALLLAVEAAVRDPQLDVVRGAVWDAASALLAFDYAGELYDAELDVVELAAHAGDPAAVLLLPMLKVMKEKP